MSIDEQTHDRIDAYLNNALTTPERKVFEAEVMENPELAEQVEIHRY